MEIHGIEGLSPDEVRSRVNQGGRFVIFTWTVSFIVMTVRRPTAVIFINPGESALLKSLPYTLISLFFGWWGIPWGFIYTPMSIFQNLGGGRDVTAEMMPSFGGGAAGVNLPPPAASNPGTAFGGAPAAAPQPARLSDHTQIDGEAKTALYLGLAGILCLPVGWAGVFFGVRAIGKARSHGLSAPGTAIAGIVLGGLMTLCTGSSLLIGLLAPKPVDPPPVVSRPSTPPDDDDRASPPPVTKNDGPTVEPGGGSGPHLELTIVKSYPKHKPSPKPPWHVPGGDWTYLDLRGEDGVTLTFGIQFKKTEEMFGFGKAELFASPGFADAFDAQFGGAPGETKPKKPAPLKLSAAILGQDVKRHRGGGFGKAGEGTWLATKLFPELGDRQGEVFFNFSVEEGRAELTEKDADYADDLSFVFHSAFAGK